MFLRIHPGGSAGSEYFYLRRNASSFYLLCHSFKHFLHGGVGIRQICDMVQMIRIYGRKNRLGNVLAAVRRVSHDVFLYQSAGYRRRYLGFSMKQVGQSVPQRSFTRFRSASDRYSRCRFVWKIECRTNPQCKHYPVCGRDRGGKAHSRGNLEIAGSEASYMKTSIPMRRGIRFAPGCIHAANPEMAGAGRKEQKSSIEVGAGRVELLKKYDMIRTADGKKRGDAHAGRIQRKVKTLLRVSPHPVGRWKKRNVLGNHR